MKTRYAPCIIDLTRAVFMYIDQQIKKKDIKIEVNKSMSCNILDLK